MWRWLRSSLPARAGMAVALIATLALVSTLGAGLIAWVSEHDAAAINMAGSLRMATYHLSWKIGSGAPPADIKALRDDLQRRVDSTEIRQVLGLHSGNELHGAYAKILRDWQQDLSPALARGDYPHFLARADAFVAQLNAFTSLLQQQSEDMQSLQLDIQGIALMVTVIVLLIGMYQLESSVIAPLQELSRATEHFRAGDYETRVDYRSEDELGQMALGFNAMASAIEESHRTLETRVAQKTQNLERANAVLALLNRSSRLIATSQISAANIDEMIRNFQALLPDLELTLCLHGSSLVQGGWRLALHGNRNREICSSMDCANCERELQPHLAAYPVCGPGQVFGELRVRYPGDTTPLAWEEELVQAMADLIGTALSFERQREIDHRILLLDERATIARELHDSLAQALSYMKLQISRLQTLISRGEPASNLEPVAGELREGINNAYRQLRELLTTFRLQIKEGNLEQALNDTAREFSERGNFEVILELAPIATPLSASEQIHILQITREALSNCARHAAACHAWVHLAQCGEMLELVIRDDGCGLSLDFDQRQHHGIAIMSERASSLHGQLDLEPNLPRGTCVRLCFQPDFLGQHPQESST